jgi:hypothetical protein
MVNRKYITYNGERFMWDPCCTLATCVAESNILGLTVET